MISAHERRWRGTGLAAGAALFAAVLAACADAGAGSESAPAAYPRAHAAAVVWRAGMDTLMVAVDHLDSAVQHLDNETQVAAARAAFADARRAYKRVELALEYYTPSTARGLNGPALPEVEETEGPEVIVLPTGFQVVEESLFGDAARDCKDRIAQEVRTLSHIAARARTMLDAQLVTDDRVWDAAKLEVARIVTLGISGFDSPVADHALPEADAALDGVARALAPFADESRAWEELASSLAAARLALQATATRADFNPLGFIVSYANPLATRLARARQHLQVGVPVETRAFRMDAASLFDLNAFNVMAFAPPGAPRHSPAEVELGAQLFADTRLSGDGSQACTTCHVPSLTFADGQAKSPGRKGTPLPRNTPTVINVGLQVGAFADLRTGYLEDQVTAVVESDLEMNARMSDVLQRLGRDSAIVRQFRAAFPGSAASVDSTVTSLRLRRAIAAYLRSLVALDAPVDRALRGDSTALSRDARRGFNVYVGKGRCATCHSLPLTNGTVPPLYQRAEPEVLGVPVRADTARARLDPDGGRFLISRAEPHRHAFRTPTLRNVALTAPYMHNGAYPTLESVVDFYNRGGGHGIGIDLPNQTLPSNRLNLSPEEQRWLVAFLEALTDTTSPGRR